MEIKLKDHFEILIDFNKLFHVIDRLISQVLVKSKYLPKDAPSISIIDYLQSYLLSNIGIARYARCSHSIYIVALIYINRLQQKIQGFTINIFSIHRLLISSIMVAAKFFDDFYFRNQYYAKVGGIAKAQINILENELITHMDFNVYVSQSQFIKFTKKLENFMSFNE